MSPAPVFVWKLALALALVGVIALSQLAHAPARTVARGELRRLVIATLGLYGIGAVAWLAHHPLLAMLVYAAGTATCALAAWVSRAPDTEDPPEGAGPVDEQPPPEPEDLPLLDWARFESDFRSFCERERAGAS